MEFSLNFASINLLVIFGATVAANLIGGLWYSPFLFGNFWRKDSGLGASTGPMSNPAGTFVAAFIFQFLAACMLGGLLGHNVGPSEGATLGALLGFALVFTAIGITNLFEGRPLRLVVIHAGYHMVALSVIGAIIGQWN
jgi:hypothetical protein